MTTSSPFTLRLFEPDIGSEECQAVLQVLESGMLSMGAMVETFEDAFANFLGVRHAIAVSSATAALHLAHHVMGIGVEDEVIVPSLTFVATASSVVYTGATPIFADIIGEQDLNIDPDDVAHRITSRTRGIVVVHYAGYPVDMDRIMHLADQHGLYVVEDASHAPGSDYHGKPLGTIGHVGCFSFYTNKNMTTAEGGMVVTNDDNLAQRMRRMRSHGMTTVTWDRIRGHAYSYDVTDLGFNYRIDEMRAALGIVQLNRLPANNKRRRILMENYLTGLSQNCMIVVPFGLGVEDVSYHICPVLLTDGMMRESVMTDLRNRGVQTSIHYPPVHLFSLYRERYGCRSGMLPITEDVTQRELTLPLYPSMCEADVEHVLDALEKSLTTVATPKGI
ncbi:MAG TPA: DegT/DnrJ/EryC1/StrS aminotransferase [Candidatus Latescibacteria bacterium]|nr:DegT/DnrJ/EryC1/StrS aminotransferase [Candidatus Latescibacterota bacterium]